MKKLKAILSITLMSVLIFSTLGFSVSRHYCMGNLVEESFYHVAESCGMDRDTHCEDDRQHLSTNCCDDETIAIPGLQVQSFSKEQLSIPIVAAFALIPAYVVLPITHYKNTPRIIDPPGFSFPSGRQILVQVQRFLI